MYEEIVKIIPIVVGGLLAVSGGVIGQIVTHRLTTSREKNTQLRARIESLMKALYGHSQWLHERHNVMIFQRGNHDIPSPIDEAQMLQELYFPELSTEVLAVMQAQIPMIKFIGEQKVSRMRDETAWLKSWNPAPYDEAYKTHLSAIKAATKKCREVLETRLKS